VSSLGDAGTGLRDLLRRGLQGIASFSVFLPKSVLLVVAIVTGLAAWQAATLRISTDVETLLPRNVESARRIKTLLKSFGGSEPVVLAISGNGGEDLEERIDLALAIRERLTDHPDLHTVTGLFGEDPWALLEGPQANALLLYLTPAEIDAVSRRLTPEAIDRRIAENREALRSPLGALTARLYAEDPLGFAGLALKQIGALKGGLRIASREGILVTEDDAYALLLLRPKVNTNDIETARRVLGAVETASREALEQAELPGTVGIGPPPEGTPPGQIHVGLAGAPAILVGFRSSLAGDLQLVSLVSYFAQLVLFGLAFRRVGGLLIAGTSLLVGAIWALGFAGLAIGEINIFTVGSIGILCGLTVDFTVHLYNRYLEEVHAGKDMARAFSISHGETGIGILASVGVMVWAFFAAGLSEFRGLRDLGLICGAGLALSLVASLFMVPALTAVWARLYPRPDMPRGLAGFGLEPVLTTVVRHPWLTIALGTALTLALVYPAAAVHLDEDFSRFRPQSNPAIRLQNEIAARTGTSLQAVLALVPGASDEEILEHSARVEAVLAPLAVGERAELAAVLGPARVVPPPSVQQASLDRLAALRASGAIDPDAVVRELLAAEERNGFRIDERAHRAAERVRAILSRDKPLTVAEMKGGPLANLLDDLIIVDDRGQRLGIVSAYPRPGARTVALIPAMREAIAASGVPAELTGARALTQEIRPIMLRDGIIATIVSAVGVTIILLLAFRRPALVLLTMVPLVTGLIASVGLMSLFGIDFNLVTISMLPLILGIAIDNGIHVVHRYVEGTEGASREDMVEVFRHTGRGVVMATLTTVVGFGALLFADNPSLISSGILAMLGTTATLIAAVTILPAMLALLPVPGRRAAPPGPK
jgi:hypothetical protein